MVPLPPPPIHARSVLHAHQVEQRFYESEDIEWTTVDYKDNKPIIELITSKLGLFALIDDECQKRADTNDDEALLANMHDTFDKPPHQGVTYERPKRPGAFVVHHYAGEVRYEIAGFIEKNRDDLSPTISELLEVHTQLKQLKQLANAEKKAMAVTVLDKERDAAAGRGKRGGGRKGGGGGRTRKKTVSESFGDSLTALMDKLGMTDHFYIRCLKPNHTLQPGVFDRNLMVRQLTYSGTLEVTKVRKAGLNVRWEIAPFFEKYKICAKSIAKLRAGSQREQTQLLLDQIGLDSATWRVGRTLVFMASEAVLEALDSLREERIKE